MPSFIWRPTSVSGPATTRGRLERMYRHPHRVVAAALSRGRKKVRSHTSTSSVYGLIPVVVRPRRRHNAVGTHGSNYAATKTLAGRRSSWRNRSGTGCGHSEPDPYHRAAMIATTGRASFCFAAGGSTAAHSARSRLVLPRPGGCARTRRRRRHRPHRRELSAGRALTRVSRTSLKLLAKPSDAESAAG